MMWGWDPLWGIVMMLVMLAFWCAVIWLIVVLAKGGMRTGSQKSSHDAEQILASRYASGEIDEDEYRRRLTVLRQVHRDID
ncbi:hypothetical protein GCM10027059_48040 [Myceligenerans halotolerans]